MEHLLYILKSIQTFVKSREFVDYNIYFCFFVIGLFFYLFVAYPILVHYMNKDEDYADD